jgi:chitodextrinase
MKKFLMSFFVLAVVVFATVIRPEVSFGSSDLQSPTRPSNLQAIEITDNLVRLRWSASQDNVGVKGYELYMNNAKIGEVTSTAARITRLQAQTTYTFKLVAFDASGNKSLFSNTLTLTTGSTVNTGIPAPTNLTSLEVGDTFLRIGWNPPSSTTNLSEYAVYLNDTRIGNVASTRARISKLNPNTIYNLKVVAIDSTGKSSSPSNSIAIRTLATPTTPVYTAPVNLAPLEISQDFIRVQWNAGTLSNGIVGYYVYLNNNRLGSVTGTAARIRNLTPDTVYNIKVVAFDARNNLSPASSTLSVKTSAPSTSTVSVPLNFRIIEKTATTIRFRWDAPQNSSNIVGYSVYQNNVKMGTVSSTGAFISGLEAGKTYEFKITSVNTNQVESAPTVPFILTF